MIKHKIDIGQVTKEIHMVIDMNYWHKVIKNVVILAISVVGVYLAFKLAICLF